MAKATARADETNSAIMQALLNMKTNKPVPPDLWDAVIGEVADLLPKKAAKKDD